VPTGTFALLNARDDLTQSLRDRNSTAANPDQPQAVDAAILFHDLVGQAHHRALDFRCRHQVAPSDEGRFCAKEFLRSLEFMPLPRIWLLTVVNTHPQVKLLD
jgi:hypothetical protein